MSILKHYEMQIHFKDRRRKPTTEYFTCKPGELSGVVKREVDSWKHTAEIDSYKVYRRRFDPNFNAWLKDYLPVREYHSLSK